MFAIRDLIQRFNFDSIPKNQDRSTFFQTLIESSMTLHLSLRTFHDTQSTVGIIETKSQIKLTKSKLFYFNLRNWTLDPTSRKWSRDDSIISHFNQRKKKHVQRSCSTPVQKSRLGFHQNLTKKFFC